MPSPNDKSHGWKAVLFRHETILLLLLAAEWLYFYFVGTTTNRHGAVVGFGTMDRQFDILRHSCEIGLLALALTPIILTGGIDLSVGSMLGLCAITFGKLWHDAGLSIPLAAAGAIGVGALGGGVNAALITRLRLPPLIVTLGTMALFRGLAEAITHARDSFTGFPASFTNLGLESWLGVPQQEYIFIAVLVGVWLLVHKTTFGRSFRAIGFSPEGARYAGLPVERRLALVYILAGVIAALAALIFTARLGQVNSTAGTGYELYAITAVVLGGTSIFGGVGSVWGTLLGIMAIAVLDSGLGCVPAVIRANNAEELSGMLTGALLLVTLTGNVALKYLSARRSHRQTSPSPSPTQPPQPA
jgi:rhamnose transport system permease protein